MTTLINNFVRISPMNLKSINWISVLSKQGIRIIMETLKKVFFLIEWRLLIWLDTAKNYKLSIQWILPISKIYRKKLRKLRMNYITRITKSKKILIYTKTIFYQTYNIPIYQPTGYYQIIRLALKSNNSSFKVFTITISKDHI